MADIFWGSLLKLEQFIRSESYRGYDPYDGLSSPWVRTSLRSRPARVTLQQIVRRLPLNPRRFMNIAKGYNPVTLALCLDAYGEIMEAFPERRSACETESTMLTQELLRLRLPGFSGSCWGYDFDWESRRTSLPAGTPTIVATGIVTNALFRRAQQTEDRGLLQTCASAVAFVRRDLQRTAAGDAYCFSYSPYDSQCVLNASMFGSRLLTELHSVMPKAGVLEEAAQSVRFVVRHQRIDGSWPYSANDSRSWTDNFHTGYILECLDDYCSSVNDPFAQESLQRGLDFYLRNFLRPDGAPKYYHSRLYPIDATAGAQSILTLVRFGRRVEAERVAEWMIHNMQGKDGSFFYRKYRLFTNRISYMRWSNAWMFLALARLVNVTSGEKQSRASAQSGKSLTFVEGVANFAHPSHHHSKAFREP